MKPCMYSEVTLVRVRVGCSSCVLQSEAVNSLLLQTRCLLWRGAPPRRAW